MHGSGGRSALRLGTQVKDIISELFPSFELGVPVTVTSKGESIKIESRMLNDSKKAASVLGATFRPVEETIRDLIETSIELGIIEPQLRD